MKEQYLNSPERGPKTPIEDVMYPMYSHCVFNLNPRACSIDTPLHTFVPFKHVDHLHPNAVIAIAASVNQEKLTKEIYGDEVIYTPWQRPGFDIGLKIEQLIKENRQAKGILLGHHGMSSWNDDDRTCYETALEIIDRAARYIELHDKGEQTFGGQKFQPLPESDRKGFQAEILPFIRGQVSVNHRFVATVQDDEKMLRFVNSHRCAHVSRRSARPVPTIFYARRSSRSLSIGIRPAGDLEKLKTSIQEGLGRSIARTTKAITTVASARTRPPCATRIQQSC